MQGEVKKLSQGHRERPCSQPLCPLASLGGGPDACVWAQSHDEGDVCK
jgi:hypothetical protein